jgi:deazaflavin-dependent oxidoreductase (nitroreductase family)
VNACPRGNLGKLHALKALRLENLERPLEHIVTNASAAPDLVLIAVSSLFAQPNAVIVALVVEPGATPLLSPLRGMAVRLVNPVTRRFAGWMPGFALLTYQGRKSGRTYCTPINVFRRGQHYVFALTYGSESQWVKNVIAAGGCQMRRMGRDVRLVEPELIVDPSARLIPIPLRWFLRFVARVTEFVSMRAVPN